MKKLFLTILILVVCVVGCAERDVEEGVSKEISPVRMSELMPKLKEVVESDGYGYIGGQFHNKTQFDILAYGLRVEVEDRGNEEGIIFEERLGPDEWSPKLRSNSYRARGESGGSLNVISMSVVVDTGDGYMWRVDFDEEGNEVLTYKSKVKNGD